MPVWTDPALIADGPEIAGIHGPVEAARFVAALAQRLAVDAACVVPAYEDAWYYLWRERRMPANVDPLKNNLDDAEERRRLAQVFEQGLGRVVGYALPLRWQADAPGWETGRWILRSGHLYLLPGDSPMGYRLPLDSLPWEPPETREVVRPLDPSAPRGALPLRPEIRSQEPGIRSQESGIRSQGSKVGSNGIGSADRFTRTERCPILGLPSRNSRFPDRAAGSHRPVRGAARRPVAYLHAAG